MECLLVANSGAYLYAISRIIKVKMVTIIGTGTISSAVDELGESGFYFQD
jgi:hypothetical protein